MELPLSARLFYLTEYYLRRRPRWLDAPPMAAWLDRHAGPPGQALDAGCGTGRNALYLGARGHQVLGVDVSRRAAGLARRAARERGLCDRVRFVRHPASRIDELIGPFDLVLDVLGPASDLERHRLDRYANGLAKIVRPDGRFLLFTFAPEVPARFQAFEVRETIEHPAGALYVMRRTHV